jgi:hypothetical protein
MEIPTQKKQYQLTTFIEKQKSEINKINQAKKQIQEEEYMLNYDNDTLNYSLKPIGKALSRGRGRPPMPEEEKAKPSDRIICELCHKEFIRSNRSSHNKSERHKLYAKVNQKLMKVMLD